MANVLIVLAHPETTTFTAEWARASEQAFRDLGHEVVWSDLCSMAFDPVERRGHYAGDLPSGPFDVLRVQEQAAAAGMLPGDVAAEIDKVRRADRIVFHFPIWWFSPPAILKGWCERVLAHGALHSVDERFDRGMGRGKRVLFCVTTGSRASESAFNGKEGDVEMLLWPLAYVFRYLGMTVLRLKVVHGVHGYHRGSREVELRERLRGVLAAHKDLVGRFDELPVMAFNSDDDCDEQGRLKAGAESYSGFIRHGG